MNALRKRLKKINDALEWRGITWKDIAYASFCLCTLSGGIVILIALLFSEVS